MSQPTARGAERRRQERRRLGFQARRAAAAERNTHLRSTLQTFLCGLSADDQLLWIGGLMLGCATDAQLELLSRLADRHRKAPTPIGRPPAGALLPTWRTEDTRMILDAWRSLTKKFSAFAASRRRYGAVSNRTRRSRIKSTREREACLASALGQDVASLGLFDEFFPATVRDLTQPPLLTPQEMASRDMYAVEVSLLRHLWVTATLEADRTASAVIRDAAESRAARYIDQRDRMGSWWTLHTKLKKATRR